MSRPDVWRPSNPIEPGVGATGDLGLSIPVMTVPGRGGLDYTISFSYASSIKTAEQSSWVGLGWSFDPGSIVRDVQGFYNKETDEHPLLQLQYRRLEMEIFGTKTDRILQVGRPLEDIGVCNWALTKQQTLAVIDDFAVSRIAILGGDVYLSDGKTIRPSLDSWYCNREAGEPGDTFVTRSLDVARQYITGYNGPPGIDVCFAVVPEEQVM